MAENIAPIRITFGIIVLNGEPFLKYNLRALYPFAHQIVVVEGGNANSAHCATPDGHSLDRTMAVLREFQLDEDPEQKLLVVTAEDEGHPDGFWPGEKDEQSQAFSRRATGNWLWQVDVDEFYSAAGMQEIIGMLREDPSISMISFPELPFWGSFDYLCDGIFLRYRYSDVSRLFRWRPGYHYLTHRPVTVLDEAGVDLRQGRWVRADELRRRGIYMHHYYKIFLNQVSSKMTYYANRWKEVEEKKRCVVKGEEYYDKTFLKITDPFRIHMYNRWPSWLQSFHGTHPDQIQALRRDLQEGAVTAPMRNMADVDQLVASLRYRTGIRFWKAWGDYACQLDWLLRDLVKRRIGAAGFVQALYQILCRKKRLFEVSLP